MADTTTDQLRNAAAAVEAALPPNRLKRAVDDLIVGLSKSWMWAVLAMQDIQLQYRRSVLGPIWLTISTAVMVAAMGYIYARLFNVDLKSYLPYLTAGLVIWQFIASSINEGCAAFTSSQSIIQQVRMPLSIHVFRLVCRNLIILGHIIVVVPIVDLIFGVRITASILLLPFSALVLAINAVWVAILLGMASARYRDIPPIVASLVQVAFFATPVFWYPEALGPEKFLADINPLYAAIDIVRAPLIGVPFSPYSWPIILASTLVGWAVTMALFVRYRFRVVYWL